MDCIFLHLKRLDSMQQQYELNLNVETKGGGIRQRRTRVSVQTAAGKTSRQEHVYRRNRELIAVITTGRRYAGGVSMM